MRYATLGRMLTAMAAPVALASCADPQPLYVDQAWVQLNANPSAPAAGYFVIHGGEQAVRLLRVTSDGAIRIDMHQSAMANGMMTMEPVDNVDVPAKGTVRFEPGGRHIMIHGINPAFREQGKLTLTMLFSNNDRLIVDAQIRGATASAATKPPTPGSGDGAKAPH